MLNNRRVSTPRELAALKEDQGIFKRGVVDVALKITPIRRITSRGDVSCIGFMDDKEVDVIFPGRRSSQSAALIKLLDDMVLASNETAVRERRPMPSPIHIRYPLKAEGTWRTKTTEDDVPEKRYQFLAARWRVAGPGGERVFGVLPSRPMSY